MARLVGTVHPTPVSHFMNTKSTAIKFILIKSVTFNTLFYSKNTHPHTHLVC